MFSEPSESKLDLRFGILGIPIRVHPLFWLIVAFLGWNAGDPLGVLSWVAAVFASILVHEMGHAQCARHFGHSPRILLYGFGGLAIYQPESKEPTLQRAAVLICGPLAGFVLAAALIALQTTTGLFGADYLRFLYAQLLWINIGWGLLNLLPVWPLDGGQLAYTLVDGLTSFQAAKVIRILSVSTAALLSVLAFSAQQTYLALFFAYFAWINWQRWG